MSGEQRDPQGPQDPPWSPDLLADLHAGVLDDVTAQELRERAAADAEATRILAALDATSADLADAPPVTIPDDVATRIDHALRQEVRTWSDAQPEQAAAEHGSSAPSGDVVDLTARRRRRRWAWGGAGVLAAAAASVGIAVVPSVLTSTDTTNQAGQRPPTDPPVESGPPPMALRGDAGGEVTLNRDQLSEALHSTQYLGDLTDPERLLSCLRANGVDGGNPLGARAVTVDGQRAQLFILSTGQLARFRLLTVGPDCGPGTPATISDSVFGG